MRAHRITTPLTSRSLRNLQAGDRVYLSGIIFTARDAAHKRLSDIIKGRRAPPIDLKGAVLYYAGPTPSAPGRPVGSCGPTTSSRMDEFTPSLLALGVKGMIGKGDRSSEVVGAIKKHGAVYFLATGGIGALLSTKVKSSRQILFKELGPEAVHELEVKDFPLTVGIDMKGNNLYDKAKWKRLRRTSQD